MFTHIFIKNFAHHLKLEERKQNHFFFDFVEDPVCFVSNGEVDVCGWFVFVCQEDFVDDGFAS